MKDLFGNPIPNINATVQPRHSFIDWCQANQLPVILSEDQMRYISNRDLFTYILRDAGKAEKLTCAYENITEIAMSTLKDIQEAGDLTEREAHLIEIAFELGRRLIASESNEGVQINGPESIYKAIAPHFIGKTQEELLLITLNTKNRIIRKHLVFRGTLNCSVCSPHTVLRLALADNCNSIILAHNHPSGDPTPSTQDIQCNNAIQAAGKILEINLLDHIIVGQGQYISLKEKGVM